MDSTTPMLVAYVRYHIAERPPGAIGEWAVVSQTVAICLFMPGAGGRSSFNLTISNAQCTNAAAREYVVHGQIQGSGQLVKCVLHEPAHLDDFVILNER